MICCSGTTTNAGSSSNSRNGATTLCDLSAEQRNHTVKRKTHTKNYVRKSFKCRGCKRQFPVTGGTTFEDSKVPLSKWFAAIYLMCSTKNGISAHQLHRTLDITYRSSWFICHRVINAMQNNMADSSRVVIEADEAYVGPQVQTRP